jgi:AraC-like DNA-binding protein
MTARAKKLINRATGTSPGGRQVTSGPANTVWVFVDALERLGYDTESLLTNAGVRRLEFADPDARVPCSLLPKILSLAMEQRPIKNLAARLASETPIGAFQVVDYLVVTSETVGAALKQLSRYLRLNEAPYALDPKGDEDPIRVLLDRPLNAFVAEFAVTLIMLHLRKETEQQLNVTSVSFSHTPDDTTEIEQLLGCAIHINASWNGFQLPREAWEMPMRRRDPVLRRVLEQHADQIAARIPKTDILAHEVRRVLASRMVEGDTKIQSVARALATSARSLQRRLAETGVSYQLLLDLTRQEAAGEYLSNPRLSIGEVAYVLGYSEPAAFHRAFKRWNGITPQSFRDQRRDGRAFSEAPAR